MFFFSSRRRHTRCLSDWSSDVCSSDLLQQFFGEHGVGQTSRQLERGQKRERAANLIAYAGARHSFARLIGRPDERSEERRVGKECRSRGLPEHSKEKEQKTQRRHERVT